MEPIPAKVTSKGQITLPKALREALGVEPGDEVEFVPSRGSFQVRKRTSRSPFDDFVGHLDHLKGRDPDEILEELRGRP
ncbi:MAG: AbrB/MazE/SpoVT family DNA-binding domain-containing protein [Deltaproteobacteria bacterium]|nr:AbrB/MazE/SpoVT family DNA-binding domain-containing protein [Deltaproteobacteria bacterium]